MLTDPSNPVFQSAIAPFVLTFVLVGAATLLPPDPLKKFAVCFGALGLITTYALSSSWAAFPPTGSSQKMGYLILLSAGVSVVLSIRDWHRHIGLLSALIVVLLGIWWLAQSRLNQGQYLEVGLVTVGALVALVGFRSNRTAVTDSGVSVVTAALALGVIAFLAPSVSITLLSFSAAAATGAFLLWTWPKPRLFMGDVGVMALAVPLLWMGVQASFYSQANDLALAIAVLIAFSSQIRSVLFNRPALETDFLRPVVTGFIGALIGIIAVAVAYSTSATGFYTG